MGIVAWIIVGAIGGWLASFIVKVPGRGLIGNIIAGVVGGVILGWLIGIVFNRDVLTGIDLTSIIVAFIGAIIVSAVYGMVIGRGKNMAQDAAKSAGNITSSASSTVQNTASSATNMAQNTASSATNMAQNTASSATNMAQNTASGATDAAKSAAGGAMGAVGAMGGAIGLDQMTGMLNGIMGGSAQLDVNSPLGQMVMPMADGLTAKLGLPKQVGQMVVVFAMSKLAEMMKGKMGGAAAAPMSAPAAAGTTMPSPNGATTDQVLGRLSAGQGMDASAIQSMGLDKELASKTGISQEQATQGLQYAMGALSAGMSGQKTYEGITLPDMSMLTGLMK